MLMGFAIGSFPSNMTAASKLALGIDTAPMLPVDQSERFSCLPYRHNSEADIRPSK
jgi:hypothetical protein